MIWTTYGTWLPGDERGWVKLGVAGIQEPDPVRKREAHALLKTPPVILDETQRHIVEATITRHCEIRQWVLHAVNARSNHVHVVVSGQRDPHDIMDQFKAWCSRKLNTRGPRRPDWWTKYGKTKWIHDETYLQNAIGYVVELQGE